jgi:RNA polymerase sigma-70 factor (ECF subfamily)
VSSLAVLRPGEALAAVPSIGRAVGVEPRVPAREADVTHALFERHARQIYNYCLHQLSSREEAEDAVQTTFMNAFRGLKRGVVPEAEQAWLFKIAENVCLSRRRSSWRRGRVESPNDFEVLQEIVPSRGSRADELIGLEDALEAMPENQRRAILLREWQGLSYREIADELAISQAAVETLIFRARRTLAQGLEDSPSTKRRVLSGSANGFSAGSLLAALKSAFTGGAAVKAVALAVAAGTVTVAATHPPKRAHVRHTHASATMGSHTDAAQSARTRKVMRAERSSAPTRAAHATRSARPDRLRKRTVTASVVVAHGQSAQPPADAPTPPPAAPPPPSPADQPAATPPAAAPPAPTDDNKVGSGASGDPGKGSGSGHAYGREKNAADQTAPPAPADGKGNANGKKKDAAPPPAAPPAAATPPSAPATAPPAAAPPAAPAEPAPAQAEDHGNGQDNGHGGGKDKSK